MAMSSRKAFCPEIHFVTVEKADTVMTLVCDIILVLEPGTAHMYVWPLPVVFSDYAVDILSYGEMIFWHSYFQPLIVDVDVHRYFPSPYSFC